MNLREDLDNDDIAGTLANILNNLKPESNIDALVADQMIEKAGIGNLGDYTILVSILSHKGEERLKKLADFLFGDESTHLSRKIFGVFKNALNSYLQLAEQADRTHQKEKEYRPKGAKGGAPRAFAKNRKISGQAGPQKPKKDKAVDNEMGNRKAKHKNIDIDEKSTSAQQAKTMTAACKSDDFRKKVDIPKKVACDFHDKDRGEFHKEEVEEKAELAQDPFHGGPQDPPNTSDQGAGVGSPGQQAKSGKSGQPGLVGENMNLKNMSEAQISRMIIDMPKDRKEIFEAVMDMPFWELKKHVSGFRGFKTAGTFENQLTKRELQEVVFIKMTEALDNPVEIKKHGDDLQKELDRGQEVTGSSVDPDTNTSSDVTIKSITDDPDDPNQKNAVVTGADGKDEEVNAQDVTMTVDEDRGGRGDPTEEVYADEEDGTWYVFGLSTGFAYPRYSGEEGKARQMADQMNKERGHLQEDDIDRIMELSGLEEEEGDHGYVAMYNGQKIEVYARNKFAAQEKAVAEFQKNTRKKVKGWDIALELAERPDGSEVVHDPMMEDDPKDDEEDLLDIPDFLRRTPEPEAKDDAIIADFEEGMDTIDIAEHYRISEEEVAAILEKEGHDPYADYEEHQRPDAGERAADRADRDNDARRDSLMEAEDSNVLRVENENGIPWTVRIVNPGDKYGRDHMVTHEKDKPLVEFYDARHDHTEGLGQFVSRYYVDTLLGRDDYGSSNSRNGLNLQGDVPEWTVDAAAMNEVHDWLESKFPERDIEDGGIHRMTENNEEKMTQLNELRTQRADSAVVRMLAHYTGTTEKGNPSDKPPLLDGPFQPSFLFFPSSKISISLQPVFLVYNRRRQNH